VVERLVGGAALLYIEQWCVVAVYRCMQESNGLGLKTGGNLLSTLIKICNEPFKLSAEHMSAPICVCVVSALATHTAAQCVLYWRIM